jgi:hypothetical protein
MAFAMAMAAEGGAVRRKLDGPVTSDDAELKNLHFVVGGPRFRPCLEDILEMLALEFDVHGAPGWREVLAQGRAKWRCIQSRAVARDCPSAAVAALTDLGYTVTLPDTGAVPDRFDRMTAL